MMETNINEDRNYGMYKLEIYKRYYIKKNDYYSEGIMISVHNRYIFEMK